jgi:bifunctional non-homologous end joining protein LigD
VDQVVEVEGRTLKISNLDKVLYPSTGTTKGEVLAYVTAVSEVLLPHLRDRALTRKRWPDGVEGNTFFEKNVPRGTPSWVRTVNLPVPGSTMKRETIDFPLIDDLPGLVWTANLAALELHVPQWRVGPRGGTFNPDRLVVDLDPGPPAGLPECVELALAVRDRLADDGLDCYPVTSGGKGLQLYAPVQGTQDVEIVHAYAKRLAEELEKERPKLVVSRMTKVLRKGKVLLDWSQNNAAKTTICPYSPRGRERPTVAAPRTWDELEEAAGKGSAGLRQLEFDDVVARVGELGDVVAGVLPKAGSKQGRGPKVPAR